MNRVLLHLDLSLPYDLPRVIQASLAQLPVFALRAYVRVIIDQLYVNDRAQVAADIIDNLVPPQVVYQNIPIGQTRDQKLPVMIERGAQCGHALFHWQHPLQLPRLYIVQQQLPLVAFRHRAHERRLRRVTQQRDNPGVLVLDVPQGFAVASVVQLNQTIVISVQEVTLVLRYPVQRCYSFVRVRCGRRECSNSPVQ